LALDKPYVTAAAGLEISCKLCDKEF